MKYAVHGWLLERDVDDAAGGADEPERLVRSNPDPDPKPTRPLALPELGDVRVGDPHMGNAEA
jgi:hypothetical protein